MVLRLQRDEEYSIQNHFNDIVDPRSLDEAIEAIEKLKRFSASNHD